MSIFDTIKAFFAGGSRSGKLYIIDAAQLSGGGSERLGPREQVQVLQHLSRFVEKEKIGVQAVFEGRALREVAHGENYGGVQVFFADNTANLQNLLLDLLKKGLRSKQAVLVTGTRQVEERAISMGGLTLRPSTFRKAFENGGGGGGGGEAEPLTATTILGRWDFEGERRDGVRRTGTINFAEGGTHTYTVRDADGQSDGSGTGTWSLTGTSTTITFETMSTWVGVVSGDSKAFVLDTTSGSNHGIYDFKR